MQHHTVLLFALSSFCFLPIHAQVSKYKPCPLLGPYLPPPQIDATSPDLKSAFEDFTSYLNKYVKEETGDFGPITPNTTTFSIALFAGNNYVQDEANPSPFFYEYHHTASELSTDHANAGSVYAIGDLTKLFSVLTVLMKEGESAWSRSIVDYLPELSNYSENASSKDATQQVDWDQVTLGDLSGHMAGVTQNSGACQIDAACHVEQFLRELNTEPPVELPGTTPIYSHAAFQLLVAAMERKTGISFSSLLDNDILDPLRMTNSSLLQSNTTIFGDGLSHTSLVGEPASLGLVSSISDLSRFGRAILTSQLLSAAQTRRWLSPIASTSNLRNAVGRPWDIYHYSDAATDPIIDMYTKIGSIGRYSSYFGLAPAFDIGFTILAVDTESASDLNAIADIVLGALLQIQSLGRKQTEELYTGTYHASTSDSQLQLELTGSDPGIRVSELTINGTDWLASIASLAEIDKTSHLDLRLYPTYLEQSVGDRKVVVFQGVIQDKSALVDAGTPTCVSWMTVGELGKDGQPIDRFLMEYDSEGVVQTISWPALGVAYQRGVQT